MTERGLKNINVFYSTFTNVFFIFVVFYVFDVFYFFLERFFTSMLIGRQFSDEYKVLSSHLPYLVRLGIFLLGLKYVIHIHTGLFLFPFLFPFP